MSDFSIILILKGIITFLSQRIHAFVEQKYKLYLTLIREGCLRVVFPKVGHLDPLPPLYISRRTNPISIQLYKIVKQSYLYIEHEK